MKVGENIFIKTTGNAARYGGSKIIDTTICKVGIKYFEVRALPGVRFYISNLTQDTNYSTSYRVYNSREAIEEEDELIELRDKLRKTFDHWNRTPLTLDQYRRIDKIVSEGNAL